MLKRKPARRAKERQHPLSTPIPAHERACGNPAPMAHLRLEHVNELRAWPAT